MTSRQLSRNASCRRRFYCDVIRAALLLTASVSVLLAATTPAVAITIFSENFQGYTSFPHEIPDNDPVNQGLPVWWEGSQETWYGARFDWPDDNSSIDDDLAVQKWGGGSNNSHTGRVSDSAGMLFHISTVGLDSVSMSYDWRTFLASGNSRLKVGYFVGNLSGHLEVGLIPDFANFQSEFGVNWWSDEWVQTTSGQSNSWQSKSVSLPAGEADVWVAFWMKGGACEYGKLDNICVTGTEIVPEPSSIAIALMGGALCGCVVIRRRVAALQSGTAR
ncbi:MAG: PEP-CTERM sorting domain-containing protein [Candidatus Hydrogenedentales bacterium]